MIRHPPRSTLFPYPTLSRSDTSVLIDVLRRRNGRRELLAELVRAGHTLSTTALNIAEVYGGMRPGETAPTEAFLGELECQDRKSTRLNSSHLVISYAVFCLK